MTYRAHCARCNKSWQHRFFKHAKEGRVIPPFAQPSDTRFKGTVHNNKVCDRLCVTCDKAIRDKYQHVSQQPLVQPFAQFIAQPLAQPLTQPLTWSRRCIGFVSSLPVAYVSLLGDVLLANFPVTAASICAFRRRKTSSSWLICISLTDPTLQHAL
jgi:hypothetical protein